MIILGIDPGLAITGYGFVEEKGNRFHRLAPVSSAHRSRHRTDAFAEIYDRVVELIREYRPHCLAWKNFLQECRTALQVGEARERLFPAAKSKLDLYEYPLYR